MTYKSVILSAFVLITTTAFAQKGKVQTAWRALSDYEETLKDGKPNLAYLNKAKEAIDMALTNDDTKNQAKTYAYKLRISYAQYQYNLAEELKRLEATVGDKNERTLVAYGNTSLTDFDAAAEALNKIKDIDPKYLDMIQEGLTKSASSLDEDELKFALATQQMKMEAANIASGKYKAKKYEEAADYFYKTGFMNTILYKTKDTANFYNATIAAAKSRNTDKILDYNKKMIDAKIGTGANYTAMYNAYVQRRDSAAAIEILKKGRSAFPADASLLIEETNVFLAKGRQQEALANLKLSVEKDPKNAFYYVMIGNIYDNQANPKDKTTGKDLEKPANFDELFKGAETNYLKAIELSGSEKEYQYSALYNLGAMYNNYGGFVENHKIDKITDLARYQKENAVKSQEYYKKAIPFLEQALSLKPDDKPTMNALRLLYFKTNQEAKAKEMSAKINAGK